MMKKILWLTFVAALSIILLAACGGNEDPAVAFCDALTELNETAPTIAALGEAADLAQIVQLGTAMDNNWMALSNATEAMDEATQATFAPFNEQYTSIPAITQETAMPVARASLEAKNAIATEAYAALYAGNCQ
jgi:hypothetical protein